MTDFPRGWTLSAFSSGGTASITVPATAGVVHVLDAFEASVSNGGAGIFDQLIDLSSSDGVFTAFPIGFVVADATSGGSDSGSALDLAAGPGASMTVAYGGGAAGVGEYLRIQGHDI